MKDRYGAALQAADLREDFRFHNIRHTFGSTVIATPTRARSWIGWATPTWRRRGRYLAFVDRADDADRVSEAFRPEQADETLAAAN